jgi:RHS repeat-associated protein
VSTYKPFGVPIISSSTLKERVRYAGEMQDGASGLYYIFARYMDPETGRFISLDPQLGSLSAPQTLNRYVYCVNNPLRLVLS